jgi:hypothetical protein
MTGAASQRTCPGCGGAWPGALPFCPSCGAVLLLPLDETALAPTGFGVGETVAPTEAPAPVPPPPPHRRARERLVEPPLAPPPPAAPAAPEAPRPLGWFDLAHAVPPAGAPPDASELAPAAPTPGGAPAPIPVVPPGAATPALSALAVVGFIAAFVWGPAGLVLSLIAFGRIKAARGRLRGEWLAVLGAFVGMLGLLWVITRMMR